MSKGKDGEDESVPGNVILFVPDGQRRPRGKRVKGAGKVVHRIVPVVPQGEFDPEALRNEATSPTRMARAAAVMRNRMYSFEDIADFLGYPDARAVRSAVAGYVASLDGGADLETLRFSLLGALENQVRRSISFASADFFEDEFGNRFPNDQRLAWHKEARQDLEAFARISGAQAAAQIQMIAPEAAELDEIVRQLEIARGHAVEEADVIELDVLDVED